MDTTVEEKEKKGKDNPLVSLEYIMETYALPGLGVIPKAVMDTIEITDVLLTSLLYDPVKSLRAPLFHTLQDTPKVRGLSTYLPILDEYVPYLQCMIMIRYAKAYTYPEGVERLEAIGYKVSSKGQLVNIFNRMETKLELADKRRASIKAVEERKLKPRRTTGKQLEQLSNAREIKYASQAITRLEKEKKAANLKLARLAKKQGLTGVELRENIRKQKEQREPKVTLAVPKDEKILYTPTEKQILFHSAGEKIVLYGGAAGGGKSFSMLMDALRYCMHGDYRALIIRKTSPMLKELIGVSRQFYPKAFPGAKYNKQESVWYFPSGATIEFGYLDKPEDLERYQGLPYAYIGFDEIQHQRTPEGFEYLMSRLRSANPAITCYMRASANPGGSPWVKEYFIDPSEPNTTFWKSGLSYKFIPARLEDNPYLDTPEEGTTLSAYRMMLQALPETQRKQLLEGDWLVGDDQMFAFLPLIHVTDELPPLHWNRIRGMDYGFNDPAATLWAAMAPDNTLIVYDEHELTQTPAAKWYGMLMEKERQENGDFGILAPMEEVIDWSVFRNTGHTGPGILEQINRLGGRPRPADRNREAGWDQIHNRLLTAPGEQPKLLIHSSCVRLIDQLQSARINAKKPDDIDETRAVSKGRKHHWDLLDVLRYICMARPSTMSFQDRALKYKSQANGMDVAWGYFGR